MTDFTAFLTDGSVANFFLLLVRLGGMFVFLPFFNSPTVFITVKTGFVFFLTLMFYPMLPPLTFEPTIATLVTALITELALGMAVGLILQVIFAMLQYAGELIAFVMGFTMASTMDPQTGTSTPITSQFLNFFAIMIFLAIDAHHTVIMFMYDSLGTIPLGGFLFEEKYIEYMVKSMTSLFIFGFSLAFPILALSLLSDIIFGMIMKTMPSFNLLVIGFPVKIAIAFIVLMAILSSMVVVFKNQLAEAFRVIFSFIGLS